MVGLTALLFWLLTDDGFRVREDSVTFVGLRHADEVAVREHLEGIDRGPNVFRVRASEIVQTVSVLPEVDAASARVTLPAEVSVRLVEREPIFVWSDGAVAWLVDEDGMLFGPTGSDGTDAGRASEAAQTPGGTDPADAGDADAGDADTAADAGDADTATDTANDDSGGEVDGTVAVVGTGLPVIQDDRLPAEPPSVGSHLPAADLTIMRQLLALTPELLGSRSSTLDLRVDEKLGYVLTSDRGWQAVFGRYSPRVQPADHIPRQVQCLQALLAAEERKLERVRLSLSETGCGTFTKRG